MLMVMEEYIRQTTVMMISRNGDGEDGDGEDGDGSGQTADLKRSTYIGTSHPPQTTMMMKILMIL